MLVARGGPVEASWDEGSRTMRLRFRTGPALEGHEREALRTAMRGWVGHEQDYLVLADCSRLPLAAMGLRLFFTEFFRQPGGKVRVAAYGLSATQMFFLGLVKDPFPLNARAFPSEEQALEWLGVVPA